VQAYALRDPVEGAILCMCPTAYNIVCLGLNIGIGLNLEPPTCTLRSVVYRDKHDDIIRKLYYIYIKKCRSEL